MANTTNPGTRLIEEGALLPESLRSESEPWSSFYMSGEIIRELRKTHENKQVSVPATKDDMYVTVSAQSRHSASHCLGEFL
jgi:hypothetical protein